MNASFFLIFAGKASITSQVSVVCVKPCLVLSSCEEGGLLNLLHSSTGNQFRRQTFDFTLVTVTEHVSV